jgi:hypothetical protein
MALGLRVLSSSQGHLGNCHIIVALIFHSRE